MNITEWVDFNWDDTFPGEETKNALKVLDSLDLSQESIALVASMCFKSLAEYQDNLLEEGIETDVPEDQLMQSMVMIRQSLDDINDNLVMF